MHLIIRPQLKQLHLKWEPMPSLCLEVIKIYLSPNDQLTSAEDLERTPKRELFHKELARNIEPLSCLHD